MNGHSHGYRAKWRPKGVKLHPIGSDALFKLYDSLPAGPIEKSPKTKTSVLALYTRSAKAPQPRKNPKGVPSRLIRQLSAD